MTAINAFARGDKAYVLTDTAYYDDEGVIKGFGSKAFTFPHLSMVIIPRGAYRANAALAAEISVRFTSFDAFADAGPAFLSEYHDDHLYEFAKGGDVEFDLVVCGFSVRSGRAEVRGISSFDYSQAPNGTPPFTWNRQDVIIAPTPEWEDMERGGIVRGGLIVGEPVDVLPKIIELQRHMVLPCGSGSDRYAHVVGGQAILTEIRRDGITQRVLKNWNDRLGEMIQPEQRPAFENVTALKLNRKERRALGKRSIYA